MAAAYAALVSLTHNLHQILHPPPAHQIIVVREQIEYLGEKVSCLTDFLENYSSRRSKEIEDLETRIADAAYAAEDIIESNVMNQILAKSVFDREKSSTLLCDGIQTVIEKFISIEKELVKIKDKKGMDALQTKNSTTASSSRPLSSGKNSMVGFDDHLIQIMSALTTDESNLRIIPIVGMGGIGKTTLSTNVYNNPFIMEHFYIRAWVTVSQEYRMRELLLGLLHQTNNIDPNDQERSDDQLGELLHKELYGRKYLIVMDMWNIEAWDMVKKFLPSNNNGSRILVTTRILKLALFLDAEKSWDLLREKILAKESCPVELEDIGKSIAQRCRGLPLALFVIGGLLAKSKRTREHWKSVEGDVTSAVNYENDEHCMKILSLSYSHLPIYLKPCFLYLALFPEDFEIHVSRLVRLWDAEGFIKPTTAKNLEEVAEEYMEDLIDRNLILVRKRGSSGKVKTCSIHDLLRDLCSKQAHTDKFLHIAKLDNPNISPYTESERRLSIHHSYRENYRFLQALQSATLNRSLLSYFKWKSVQITRSFRLLRVLDVVDSYFIDEILQPINSRANLLGNITFPCSLSKLTLSYCKIPWKDMSMIGLLPNLEVLKLRTYAAKGQEWNPVEGEFLRLKFLLIRVCDSEIWGEDNTHFPSLELLNLEYIPLKEIPMGFEEIPTLQLIHLNHCSSSLLTSAKELSEQRESLGYEGLQVRSFSSKVRKTKKKIKSSFSLCLFLLSIACVFPIRNHYDYGSLKFMILTNENLHLKKMYCVNFIKLFNSFKIYSRVM
ncbi:hypothetical protein Pfo_020332 [Paulownia fortunei]|nr:hypothetical protein Pfo_020332 [Paulownia fortunei]